MLAEMLEASIKRLDVVSAGTDEGLDSAVGSETAEAESEAAESRAAAEAGRAAVESETVAMNDAAAKGDNDLSIVSL